MKYFRVILRIPVALTFDALTQEQQQAIYSVFGQFVMPMPGTIPTAQWKLCDAVTGDNFDPNRMSIYGFNWPIVGMWDNDGVAIEPFDEATFMEHLPMVQEYDPSTEQPIGEPTPPVLHEPHQWAGWPKCFG